MARALRLIVLVFVVATAGCFVRDIRWMPIRPPWGSKPKLVRMVTTGYCPCGLCCNWRRTWYGRPVLATGPQRGRTKAVGYTASGTYARSGTLAADAKFFSFGTIMYIPGYGYGRVEDRGGEIKGWHIDLFFRNHADAEAWGRRIEVIKVWYPSKR